MTSTLRRAAVIALVCGAALSGACGGDSGTDPEPPGDPNTPATGTFTLSSVDTKSLPFAIIADSFYKLEVTAGAAVLDTNGKFILPLTTRETFAGAVSTYVDTTRGTWIQNAGVIMMTASPATATTTATWDGKRLTIMMVTAEISNTYTYSRKISK